MGQYPPAVAKSPLSFFPEELNKLSCLSHMLSHLFSETFFIPFLWTYLKYFHTAFETWTPKLDTVPNNSLTTVVHAGNIKSSYLLDITLFFLNISQDCIGLLATELQWDFILRCSSKKNPKSFSKSLLSKREPPALCSLLSSLFITLPCT